MIRKSSTQQGQTAADRIAGWLCWLTWGIAILMMAFTAFLLVQRVTGVSAVAPAITVEAPTPEVDPIPENSATTAALPDFSPAVSYNAVQRETNSHTTIPDSFRREMAFYTVDKGDSVFSIAVNYDLKPETVLWANYDLLNDNPNMLSIGQELTIPATDGVLYKWKEGDSLQKIADQYYADIQDILMYPGNKLNLTDTDPQIEPGTYVMIPGGWRENQQWLIPTMWSANSGANKSIPGACSVPEGGAIGSGSFIWPADNHYLSGNDFWSGHLGIDIAAATGAPIYAADSGVVVYAAPIGGGYGNMIMIDHQNGVHTLYAHLSSINVNCGASVYQGQLIGLAGSTGNSTGPHLHFEIRQFGAFINPWHVLP